MNLKKCVIQVSLSINNETDKEFWLFPPLPVDTNYVNLACVLKYKITYSWMLVDRDGFADYFAPVLDVGCHFNDRSKSNIYQYGDNSSLFKQLVEGV